MAYILPDKSLLEEKSPDIEDIEKYYSLSKITFKKDLDSKLLFPVGLNTEDKYYIDFENRSSLLITGETGSGKSVFINSIIVSLLLKNTPDELKFLFIDPRGAELGIYNGIPHLLKPVIRTKQQALYELESLAKELKKRQDMFVENDVSNIGDYNDRWDKPLPHIIAVIDEAANIIDDNDFERTIFEMITDGYRYGIHIIMATSSYLRNRLTSFFIRSFNYVITFDLAMQEQADFVKIDGADLLTVSGEALVKCNADTTIDLQTPYVSEKDINNIVSFIKKQRK